MGGVITENEKFAISWNIAFGTYPSTAYAEAIAVYETFSNVISFK